MLIRSNVGVTPTDAGRELYRHAVLMLKQLEQAEFEVPRTANIVTGNVSVGLATYSSTSVLATPLLKRVRQEYPHVNLFINDNFGLVLSEMVMSGGMDMAVIYGAPVAKGVKVQPLLLEELFFIAPARHGAAARRRWRHRAVGAGRDRAAAARAYAFPAAIDRQGF